MKTELAFTGERFVPGAKGEIWIEHWHRYHFASRWVEGKAVLDVACGEGYGSALLARRAARVTGVDIAPQAIEHARRAYEAVGNLDFICAPCARLPLADASVDVAVSFETIEHIAEQAQFLDELVRVLKPDGVLILSCPNKLEYSDKRGFVNEFHVKELYREELAALVSGRFPQVDWYGQRPTFFSLIAPESRQPASAQLVETTEAAPDEARDRLSDPLYFVLVAGRSRAAIEALAPALSILADRDDWVHRDYEKVMRYLQQSARHGEALQAQLDEQARALAGLEQRARELQEGIAAGEARLAAAQGRAASMEAGYREQLAAQEARLAAKEAEIARRAGWRWWLKLPLIRLGVLRRKG